MEEFLNSLTFRYCIFPIGSVAIGVAVKFATRNDRYATFKKEDLAVGLDLIVTACLLFVVLTTDRAISLKQASTMLANKQLDTNTLNKLQSQSNKLSGHLTTSGWFIAAMFFGLWSISTVIRKWGWKSETEMTPVVGIALPLAVGVLALIGVMAGAAQ